MPPRVPWFVACLVLSLASTAAIADGVHPMWMKTLGEALAWGLLGSAVFLLGTVVAAFAVVTNRDAPMPTGAAVALGLLIAGGLVWALLATLVVGL